LLKRLARRAGGRAAVLLALMLATPSRASAYQAAAAAAIGSLFYLRRVTVFVRKHAGFRSPRALGFVFPMSYALVLSPVVCSMCRGNHLPRFGDISLLGIVRFSGRPWHGRLVPPDFLHHRFAVPDLSDHPPEGPPRFFSRPAGILHGGPACDRGHRPGLRPPNDVRLPATTPLEAVKESPAQGRDGRSSSAHSCAPYPDSSRCSADTRRFKGSPPGIATSGGAPSYGSVPTRDLYAHTISSDTPMRTIEDVRPTQMPLTPHRNGKQST